MGKQTVAKCNTGFDGYCILKLPIDIVTAVFNNK